MPLQYNPTLVRSEYSQRATQNALGLINGLGGAITLENEAFEGDEIRVARFKIPNNLVSRRVTTGPQANQPATILGLEETNETAARLSRKIGPVAVRYADEMGKTNRSEADFSMRVGEMLADQEAISHINSAVASAVGAIVGAAGAFEDRTASGTADTADLLAALALMGDQAHHIKAFVMHSATFYKLVGDQIANAPELVGAGNIYSGVPGTFSRPVLVTDAAPLVLSDELILGLTEGAITIRVDSNPLATLDQDKDLLNENARMLLRADPDYSISVMGHAYDIAAGNANPDDATLAATANWTQNCPSNLALALPSASLPNPPPAAVALAPCRHRDGGA